MPAPQMMTENNPNGGSNNPIDSTHKAPNASTQVNTRSTPRRSTRGAVNQAPKIVPSPYIVVPRSPKRGSPRCRARVDRRFGRRSCYRGSGLDTLPQSIAAVAIGGHIALIGVLTGRAGEIATAQLMAKQARLQGLIVGSRRHQMDFVRAIDAAHIRPVIDRSFDLDEIADAFRYEASGQHFGKICLEF